MSSLLPTSSNAPIIERILSDPITFVKAKNPDLSDNKPSSYKILYSSKNHLKNIPLSPQRDMTSVEKYSRPKPKSMAEAVAAYTGKRFATKLEKKFERREAKRLKAQLAQDEKTVENSDKEDETTQEEPVQTKNLANEKIDEDDQDEDELSTDDNDYQTADENEDEAGSSSNESGSEEQDEDDDDDDDEDDDEEESDEEEENMLGHSKLIDQEKEELEEGLVTVNPIKMASPSPDGDEDEEEEEEEEENIDANTPPTSPDNDTSPKEQLQSYLPDIEFFQIDENYNDRGSTGSDRIYKNWRELKNLKQPLGLVNQGVTCYMNAAIQALIHTPAVQHYLTDVHNNKYSSTISNTSVTKTFADTSAKIWQLDNNGTKKILMINPRKLIRRLQDINCMMSEWQQEDSHEYFMSLMTRLQEDSTPRGHKLNESIIYDIFGGLLHQSVSCQNCGHVSNTEQEFYDLSLNLDNRRKKDTNPDFDDELISKRYSIKKSLNDFFSPELIKTDKKDKSGYVCEKCKQRTNALKHNKIKRAPETLAVHLKRFRFNGTSSSKLKTGVSFPSTMDLTNFTVDGEPSRYKLISVVVHEGRSVSSGHYIAQCRQPDGSWSVYDDEYINKTTEREVLKNTSAYFLIYTRLTHKSKLSDWDSKKRNGESSKSGSPNKRQRK